MLPTDFLRTIVAWLMSHPEFAATLATAVTALGGTIRHYQQTGRIPLAQLPWRAIRRLLYTFRRHLFTVGGPPHTTPVSDDITSVTERIGRQSYELEWYPSYPYKGEVLNARRYLYDPDREYPHRQLHIRGFERDDGRIALYAHEEPSALHHPKAHLREEDMHDATEWVGERYDNGNGLDPRGFEARS